MPTNMYSAARILCPFYRTQDALSVGCEGPFEGSVISLRFMNVPDKVQQTNIYCKENYKRCEIYRCIMMNRYPEKEV